MSKRNLIVTIIAAAIAAIAVGSLALLGPTTAGRGEAATAASRAMTSTQPKAPTR